MQLWARNVCFTFFPLPTCRPGMYSDFLPCHKTMVEPKVATQPNTTKAVNNPKAKNIPFRFFRFAIFFVESIGVATHLSGTFFWDAKVQLPRQLPKQPLLGGHLRQGGRRSSPRELGRRN